MPLPAGTASNRAARHRPKARQFVRALVRQAHVAEPVSLSARHSRLRSTGLSTGQERGTRCTSSRVARSGRSTTKPTGSDCSTPRADIGIETDIGVAHALADDPRQRGLAALARAVNQHRVGVGQRFCQTRLGVARVQVVAHRPIVTLEGGQLQGSGSAK